MTVRIPKWALAALAVLLIAGIAAAAYFLGRSSGGSSSTTASTTHPHITTTKGPVTVAVKRCPTTYGATGVHPTIPDRIRLSRPIPTQPRLVFWAHEELTLLAPASWACKGLVGADGSSTMIIKPGALPAQGISAQFAPVCVACIAGIACKFFPSAEALITIPCPGRKPPTAERTQKLNSKTISFEDPANVKGTGRPSGGPYPAQGLVYFDGSKPLAMQETCTLPPAQHDLCMAVLNDFVARNRPANQVSSTSTSTTTPTTTVTTNSAPAISSCQDPGVGEGGATVPYTAENLSCAEAQPIVSSGISACTSGSSASCGTVDGFTCEAVSPGPKVPGSQIRCENGNDVITFGLPG